jgi:hypothetical protein
MHARWLSWLWCIALATLLGCVPTTSSRHDWSGVYVRAREPGPGAFFPEEWEEYEEAGSAAETELEMRRPSRRRGGGGESGRRPPPLLNPRPTPEEAQARARRAADLAVVRQARDLYFQRLAEARERYPNAEGYENHHFIPRYLGGDPQGRTYRLPKAYHYAITQEFRTRWEYRKRKPTPEERVDILILVYSRYPIPQLIGIEP